MTPFFNLTKLEQLTILLLTFSLFTCVPAPSPVSGFSISNNELHSNNHHLIPRSNSVSAKNIFEGDIVVNQAEKKELEDNKENGVLNSGIIGDHFRWRHKIIPYVISNKFSKNQKDKIKKGMKEISDKTCIRFKERDADDRNFVFVTDGNGCSSNVGRQGSGQQDLTLDTDGCVDHATVIHEFMHAIGFWHEQSRSDRDDFVEIQEDNVNNGNLHNFKKTESNTYNVPYDFSSVMHYKESDFITPEARAKGLKTIVPKKSGQIRLGQNIGMSKLDVLKVIRMYCPEVELNDAVVLKSLFGVQVKTLAKLFVEKYGVWSPSAHMKKQLQI